MLVFDAGTVRQPLIHPGTAGQEVATGPDRRSPELAFLYGAVDRLRRCGAIVSRRLGPHPGASCSLLLHDVIDYYYTINYSV